MGRRKQVKPGTRAGSKSEPSAQVVKGEYRMTEGWSITLPEKFNRRVEEGNLVLWRPGITLWIAVWGNDHGESREERLAQLRDSIPPDAFHLEGLLEDDILRLGYRLDEASDDNQAAAFYGFAVGFNGHVQIAVYFDQEGDLDLAKGIWQSLREHRAG
jgi:hypothetical protein